MLRITYRLPRGLLLALAVLILPSKLELVHRADAGEPVNHEASYETLPITLMLNPPSTAENRFGIDTELNPLVPGRGAETAPGTVDWSGSLAMDLYLDTLIDDGMPTILGVKLRGPNAGIEQSSIALSYINLPVGVHFATNTITNQIAQPSPAIIDVIEGSAPGQYVIAPGAFSMMQTGGVAGVAIENRPGEMQDLSSEPVEMEMESAASMLLIEPMEGYDEPTYLATLRMPIAGQSVQYNGTGLPVEWTYTNGELVASGMFSLTVIPEPQALTIAALLATVGGWWVRRGG